MTDDSAAFKQALRLAHENQAQLSVVSVVAAPKLHSSDANKTVNDQLVANRREELDAFVQAPTPKGETVERKLLVGKTFVEIIREALRSDHDLVVKSIEPKEYGDHLGFSTTDKKLMRKCPCPVWLIKSTQQSGFREILVGVDYELDNAENDALNRQLLELSASLAIADFSELHVVHAWRLEHEGFLRGPRTGHSNDEVDAMLEDDKQLRQRWLTTIVADCCESLGQEVAEYLKPQLHLLRGDARNVVPQCARDLGAELVVLGTVARTGVSGLAMGNTAPCLIRSIVQYWR